MNDAELIAEFVAQHQLDRAIPAPLIRQLRIKRVPARHYLCRQQTPLSHLYLLVQGKLQVDSFLSGGEQAVFAFVSPLAILGDVEVLDNAPAQSNVQALTDATLLTLPAAEVRRHGCADPAFLQFLLRQLRQKLLATARTQTLASLPLEQRLCRYLEHRGNQEGQRFQLERREALASVLGTSVRHLNRTLDGLKQGGVLTLKNRELTLLDNARLRQLADNLGK